MHHLDPPSPVLAPRETTLVHSGFRARSLRAVACRTPGALPVIPSNTGSCGERCWTVRLWSTAVCQLGRLMAAGLHPGPDRLQVIFSLLIQSSQFIWNILLLLPVITYIVQGSRLRIYFKAESRGFADVMNLK